MRLAQLQASILGDFRDNFCQPQAALSGFALIGCSFRKRSEGDQRDPSLA